MSESNTTIAADNVMNLFTFKPKRIVLGDGTAVYLRRISALERVTWIESAGDKQEKTDLAKAMRSQALLVCLCLCDAGGTRLLRDDQTDLVMKDSARLDELANAAMEVNGMGERGKAAVEKNSPSVGS